MTAKDKRFPKKLLISIAVYAILLLLIYFISHTEALTRWIAALLDLLSPILWGLAVAYLLNPVFRFFERRLLRRIRPPVLRRIFSLILTYVFLFLIVALLVALILPQLTASIAGFVSNVDVYISSAAHSYNSLLSSLGGFLSRFDIQQQWLSPVEPSQLKQWLSYLLNFDVVLEITQKYILTGNGLATVIEAVGGFIGFLTDTIFALFISLYLLASKEKRYGQVMKLRHGLFNDRINTAISNFCSVADRSFGGFIEGKLVDSLIIGILTYICVLIAGIPYASLVAAIVGITNVIPFVGPIIGAIPTSVIILLTEPRKVIPFLIIVIIIQQIDGNIIGPKILGNNTGVSSLCVLLAITTMGAVWGFLGMLLAVPLFATVVNLVSKGVDDRLRRKGIPSATENHYPTDSIVSPAEDARSGSDGLVKALERTVILIRKKKERDEKLTRLDRFWLGFHGFCRKCHILPEVSVELLMQFTAEEAALAAKEDTLQRIRELQGTDLLEKEHSDT